VVRNSAISENRISKGLQQANDPAGHQNCCYLTGYISLAISGLQYLGPHPAATTIHDFLGPHELQLEIASGLVQPIFAGLTIVINTDRQKYHAKACSNRLHLMLCRAKQPIKYKLQHKNAHLLQMTVVSTNADQFL